MENLTGNPGGSASKILISLTGDERGGVNFSGKKPTSYTSRYPRMAYD